MRWLPPVFMEDAMLAFSAKKAQVAQEGVNGRQRWSPGAEA